MNQFIFAGETFQMVEPNAVFWPLHRLLLVADLHLEKASSYAVRGQMLPPYDSIATLQALAASAQSVQAEAVICLGDNFHDDAGEARLGEAAASMLRSLTEQYDWTWITGNHDPGIVGRLGGISVIEKCYGNIMLRHEADPDFSSAEISGHFHPKFKLRPRGRTVSRPCIVKTERKLILPAFGALTGGMDAADPAIMKACGVAVGDQVTALVPTQGRLTRFALNPLR